GPGGPLAAGSRPRVDVVQVDEGFFEALGSEQGGEHLLTAALLVLFHRASIAAETHVRRTLVRSWQVVAGAGTAEASRSTRATGRPKQDRQRATEAGPATAGACSRPVM